MHVATRRNKNPAVIEVLINRGADVNARDNNKQTPLYYATRRNENGAEVIEMLRSTANDKTRQVAPSGHSCILSMLWSFFRQ